MAGRVAGKVAFITGAARGQGRSHAVRLAQEGADIIAVDVCEDMPGMPYAGATEADLAETVKEVEALDRRIVATKADVRDFGALKAALDDGVAQLGRLDIVSRQRRDRLLAVRGAGPGRADLAGHDRRQPDRRLAHRQGGHPAPGRRRPRRLDRADQLGRGPAGVRQHRALRVGQARRGRADADAGPGAGAAIHPGQQHPSHPGGHADDPERGDVPAVPARPGPPDPGRLRARLAGHERAAHPLGGAWPTSATRCCSWPPTRPATSPASRSPSTPGPSSGNEHHSKEQHSRDSPSTQTTRSDRSTSHGRTSSRQGRLHHRRRARPGPLARDPAGPGGRGHHRGGSGGPDRQRAVRHVHPR